MYLQSWGAAQGRLGLLAKRAGLPGTNIDGMGMSELLYTCRTPASSGLLLLLMKCRVAHPQRHQQCTDIQPRLSVLQSLAVLQGMHDCSILLLHYSSPPTPPMEGGHL